MTPLARRAAARSTAARGAAELRATESGPRRRRVLGRASALAALTAFALAGCVTGGSADGGVDGGVNAGADGEPAGGDSATAAPTTTLNVYAAASLTDAFEELATRFEEAYPAIDVAPIVADASSVLATQIIEGAPADVFATADEVTMAKVGDEGLLAAAPEIFAENAAVLAVPSGDPAGIRDLAGLAAPGVRFIVCALEVPCGRAAAELLNSAELQLIPVSEEQNVTAVLTKLQLGEADAGVVYRSDLVRADGAVDEIDASAVPAVVNRYPIASLGTATDPKAADAFVKFVLGAEGQAVLAEFGFSAP